MPRAPAGPVRGSWRWLLAWLLAPALFVAPLALGMRYGPVLHLGSGSARYLDLWSAMTLAAAIAVAVPAATLAHRVAGWWGPPCALAWLGALAAFAYHHGVWYS